MRYIRHLNLDVNGVKKKNTDNMGSEAQCNKINPGFYLATCMI